MPPLRVLAAVATAALAAAVPSYAAAAPKASSSFTDTWDAFDGSRWSATSHALGRSWLDPANVSVSGGNLAIRLPGGSVDGGEIRSARTYGFGSYRARMRVPDAPGSITGFFLYRPPDGASEIDVEVFDDPSGRVMFTTYSGGSLTPTHTEELALGFDPTAGFHEYRFDRGRASVTFYVDGVARRTWTTGVPRADMNLYVNAWYPAWLPGTPADGDRALLVDEIAFRAG